MTLWNPEYRVKVNGSTVTSATLAGLTITSGRTSVYEQPVAGYCQFSLLETEEQTVLFDLNDSVTIEVKKSDGSFVYLFGGFVTDIRIEVATSGATALSQRIVITATGALARLNRIVYTGNLASDHEGDQIYEVLNGLLLNSWNEVAPALTWADYDPTITWANAENTGLGEIDRPGDYVLDSQNNLDQTAYTLVNELATSGLGYMYEDGEGRINYADSTHRSQYVAANGWVELDGNHALGGGLSIVKRAGDVRNSITLTYGSSGNQSVTDEDIDSIYTYGELGETIETTLKNQSDAISQAAFYLTLRANPQYLMNRISFAIQSPEIDDADRDALLEVFMGLPIIINNLPGNMTLGQFQGFVEGWTFTAAYNRLQLDLTISPAPFSLQYVTWNDVNVAETWNTLSASLKWVDATIVN